MVMEQLRTLKEVHVLILMLQLKKTKQKYNSGFFFFSCAILLSILFSKVNPTVSCIFEST